MRAAFTAAPLPIVTHLPSMPLYDGIRDDPRFSALLARMNLGRTANVTCDAIAKLKEDQRRLRAGVAVLVTAALPRGCAQFETADGGADKTRNVRKRRPDIVDSTCESAGRVRRDALGWIQDEQHKVIAYVAVNISDVDSRIR